MIKLDLDLGDRKVFKGNGLAYYPTEDASTSDARKERDVCGGGWCYFQGADTRSSEPLVEVLPGASTVSGTRDSATIGTRKQCVIDGEGRRNRQTVYFGNGESLFDLLPCVPAVS